MKEMNETFNERYIKFTNYWFTKLDLNQGAQEKLNQNKSTLSN